MAWLGGVFADASVGTVGPGGARLTLAWLK